MAVYSAGVSRYIIGLRFAAVRMSGASKNSGSIRKNVRIGATVDIVQKQDQRNGVLTRGVVRNILTKSATHPHGIKVRLETGEVGRVKEIL